MSSNLNLVPWCFEHLMQNAAQFSLQAHNALANIHRALWHIKTPYQKAQQGREVMCFFDDGN